MRFLLISLLLTVAATRTRAQDNSTEFEYNTTDNSTTNDSFHGLNIIDVINLPYNADRVVFGKADGQASKTGDAIYESTTETIATNDALSRRPGPDLHYGESSRNETITKAATETYNNIDNQGPKLKQDHAEKINEEEGDSSAFRYVMIGLTCVAVVVVVAIVAAVYVTRRRAMRNHPVVAATMTPTAGEAPPIVATTATPKGNTATYVEMDKTQKPGEHYGPSARTAKTQMETPRQPDRSTRSEQALIIRSAGREFDNREYQENAPSDDVVGSRELDISERSENDKAARGTRMHHHKSSTARNDKTKRSQKSKLPKKSKAFSSADLVFKNKSKTTTTTTPTH